MRCFIIIIILSICSSAPFVFAQQKSSPNPIDSLNKILRQSLSDTNKVKVLRALGNESSEDSPENAMKYYNQALSLSMQLSYKIGIAKTYFDIGSIHYTKGNYLLSEKNFSEALKIYKELKDSIRISKTLNNLGMVVEKSGNYPQALDYYLKALNIIELLGDETTISNTWNNIGLVFLWQNNYEKAEYYFQKCIALNSITDNKKRLTINFNNLALVLIEKGDTIGALNYHEKTLALERELNNKKGIAGSIGNIGNIQYNKKNYKTALTLFKEALDITYQLDDDYILGQLYSNIGRVYYDLNDFDNAILYSDSAFNIAMRIDAKDIVVTSALTLTDVYSQVYNYKKALHFHILYSSYKDSLITQESTKAVTEMETKYQTEKKQKEIELLNKENEKQAVISSEQNKRKNMIIYTVVFGLFLVVVFSVFLYNRFRVTNQQKLVIEEKQKEITDSITYAKRLQTAILPPDNFWKKYLPQSFVLYQPKDIVSGDFYWLENVNDLVLCAAADCTGHGVSGAMVSVVCSNALNRTVKEFGITEPAKILDKTRELVLETFEKSNEEVKDGMDISLCCLNTETNELLWSGANNPLWYIRENNLFEIKGDKQPIGQNDNPKPFTTHSIDLQKGDTVYIFTDGYADQFGGEKGKKFMYKPLKELLLSIQNKSIAEQQEELHQKFTSWKKSTEQTDDVLVIGFKI